MNRTWSRRNFVRLLAALPAGAWLERYQALAAPYQGKVKITAIKAMQVSDIAGNCLIRIETDQGLVGYGEAGSSGPMARARINHMQGLLLGQDPLAIERHFHEMITLMHPYTAHIPTVIGIDIALWDLAGKITNLPINVLLGGPFRDAIQMYSHGQGNDLGDMQDMAKLRDWAARINAMPEGFNAFKINVNLPAGFRSGRFAPPLTSDQIRRIGRGYTNTREAVGSEIDIAVHGHNELDTTSAIEVCKAVEGMRPLFVEDPLPVDFSEGWQALRNSTRLTLLVGEKLELVKGFKPFLDRGIADILHPDLAFTGGFTGAKKIADLAQVSRRPLALHNVGSLVLCYASAHFGSAIHNFFRSESALGRPQRHVEQMSSVAPPLVRNGHLQVPEGPGLGFVPNDEYLRTKLVEGEQFWT